ncbi:MAG: T9SS type A sorting domain-containing protein [Bacteroidetes bacterium]|nr:T9SS type A sorting domain-containing protein [Bacteroidota bacterium]
MKKLTLLLTVLLCSFFEVLAYNSLKIINPEWGSWEVGTGTIDEAFFTIEPQGIYTEIGMFLTISAADLGYNVYDTFEIVLDFDLPEGSIIHDSWLWVDDVVVKAEVMDVWTASAIYEEIVDRRTDPSVLYRKPGGGYQLRVFPLSGTGSRKVKISFLAPTVWTSETVTTWLPTELLQTSEPAISSFQVIFIPDSTWAEPTLTGYDGLNFEPLAHPVLGDVLAANVTNQALGTPLAFSVKAPLNDGIFLNRYEDGADNFYQLAYLPPQVAVPVSPKRIMFLFDHESANTNINSTRLFNYFKKLLVENLNEEDHFNMGFSDQSGTDFLASNWVPADPVIVSWVLDTPNPIVNYSNLLTLLKNGIDYIKNHGEDATIVLFTSSNNLNTWNAQQNVTTILNQIGTHDIPVHIINFQTENYYFDWQDETVIEYQNQEFYKKLTQATASTLYSSLDGGGSVWEGIRAFFSSLYGVPASFDLHTSLADGFAFQRYNLNYAGQSFYQNQPVLQTGKYVGDFPMEIEFSVLTDTGVVFEGKIIEPGEIALADTLGREIWVGHHIRSLEGGNPNNSTIQNIIDISIAERVLSNYTAFLALEPNLGGEPCWGCWNNDVPVVIGTTEVDTPENGMSVAASPNPFVRNLNIRIQFGADFKTENLQVRIVDSFGRPVVDLSPVTKIFQSQFELQWDGKNASGSEVPSGIYYLVVTTDHETKAVKLVLHR